MTKMTNFDFTVNSVTVQKSAAENVITIAIFPFENLSGRSDLLLLCHAFYEDLLTEFSRFRQFSLVPHEFVSAGISAEYTFTGSFRSHNDQLRINARLLNQKNAVTWAETFEVGANEIHSLQEDLLKQVAAALSMQVNYDVLNRVRRKSPASFSAYEYWLLGMEELKKGNLESDETARGFFEKAIAIDPHYSLAFSGMSLTFFNEWSCQLWGRWDISHKGAYEWAKKAIDLDEQNYIAAVVLGRVYLYERQFEIAEFYLRKALRLNPNDIESVMQIATCLVLLGYVDEAEKLFMSATSVRETQLEYAHVGALIALEKGQFGKALEFGSRARPVWLDFSVIMAAAAFECDDQESMFRFWRKFIDDFTRRVRKCDDDSVNREAVQWHATINPYRLQSRLARFLEFINDKNLPAQEIVINRVAGAQNMLIRESGLWLLSFDGKVIRLPDAKGLMDLHKLIAMAEKDIHCTELANTDVTSQGMLVFDERAKQSYKKRMVELQEEIRAAENHNDLARTSSLQQEYDDLVDHLTASLGLKGRIRKTNDPIEKTRSAVTWRIRSIIKKIEGLHPPLGKHLNASVKTGVFCSYSPEKRMVWVLE
jgi:TolB-like protein/Tfp pilus assembly protein PilF